MTDATQRFSDRVEFYLRYRPRYPAEILAFLSERCGLTPRSVIADVGSGTGFLAELFLRNGNRVFGIEPNAEMRRAGEVYLGPYRAFQSVDGSAEETTLPRGSCDFIAAGQAFHWFDIPRAAAEFRRILKPRGYTLLLWNERRTDTPFLQAYEDLLLEFGTDYREIDHRRIGPAELQQFYGTANYGFRKFPHSRSADYEALQGRLLSCSYIPLPGQSRYAEMIDRLRGIFSHHQQNGAVSFDYDTLLYFSPLVA